MSVCDSSNVKNFNKDYVNITKMNNFKTFWDSPGSLPKPPSGADGREPLA